MSDRTLTLINKHDWRALYPFASHFHKLGSLNYHYLDEGEGEPVLMVHGNPTWSFYYRNLIQGLRNDHRAIAVDHIGCGLSDKPQDYSYTLAQHTTNLVTLIDTLDLQNTTLVAHDWGGAIGLGAALEQSDRFSRIVLLNTGAFPPPYVPLRIRACRTPLIGKLLIQGFNAFAGSAVRMAVEKRENMTPQVKAGLLAPYNSYANRIATHRFVADIPLTKRHPTWSVLETLEQRLPELRDRDICLIWGMKDWCFRPDCLTRLKQSFPDAASHELPKAGHYVLEDEPEKVLGILREFLQNSGDSR